MGSWWCRSRPVLSAVRLVPSNELSNERMSQFPPIGRTRCMPSWAFRRVNVGEAREFEVLSQEGAGRMNEYEVGFSRSSE